MSNQELVRQFMAKHNFPQSLSTLEDCPQARTLWYETGLRRSSLIGEELAELEAAWAARDIVAIADALADLQYVIHGAAVNVGIPASAMQVVFEEVHAANMTKEPGTGKRGNGDKPRGDDYRPPAVADVLRRHQFMKDQREEHNRRVV